MSNPKEKSRHQGEEIDIAMLKMKEEISRKRNLRLNFTNRIITTMIEMREVDIVEAGEEAVEAATTISITTTIIIETTIAATMQTIIMIPTTIGSTTDQNMIHNPKEGTIIAFQITPQIETLEETDIKKEMKKTALGGTKITTITITTTTITTTIITIIETIIETINMNRKFLKSNQKCRKKFRKQRKQMWDRLH